MKTGLVFYAVLGLSVAAGLAWAPHQPSRVGILSTSAFITNILDYAKIEAGKLVLETVEFNLRQVLEEVGEGISLQASHKGLELNVYMDPQLPKQVIGDPTRLRQVLLNLAGNALKFTHEGEVSIKGELASRTNDNVLVHFDVADSGIGIPDDRKPPRSE